MTHDAGSAFLFGEIDKFLEAEEQQIVGCDNEEVVIDLALVHCKEQVADGTKPCLIRFRPIINNRNGFLYF